MNLSMTSPGCIGTRANCLKAEESKKVMKGNLAMSWYL